jgi:hypothetical protein
MGKACPPGTQNDYRRQWHPAKQTEYRGLFPVKRILFASLAILIGTILLLMVYDSMGHPPLTEILHRRVVIASGGYSFDGRVVLGPIAGVALFFLGCGVYLLVAKEDDPK